MTATVQQSATRSPSPAIATNPYIGVLGVFLGAATATLYGRLISVGLPDLRGALGLGFDDASWIPTVLNMATMFIGVFAVFLGSVYGIRRVLLVAGTIFTVTTLLVPLFSWLGAMLVLQAIAGVSSGTFYTLTLTFVIRSLPKKLVLFGVAAYAMDIVVTSNVAALIEGWYIDHLSWHWIFWTAAILTPVMMLCVYFGIPKTDRGPRLSWRGFLYASAGFALIYGALDQGQRLNWWNSGTFVGMLAGGVFLLLTAFVRRYFQPNPLVNLPFLNARNVIILGLGIVAIRFALLAPAAAIPGFLGGVARYRPIETGAALAWVAIPQFALVWIAAILTVFIQPRIVMAAGFATIAIACWMSAHLDSEWAGNSFTVPELMLAAGIAVAFVALVVNLLMLAAEMGAATNVVNASTYAAWMHTNRLLGGEVGGVVFGRFVTVREQLHSNVLGYHVTAGNWITVDRLRGMALSLTPPSAGPQDAAARSAAILSGQIRLQAFSLAYSDAFLLIGWALAAYLLLIVCMRPPSQGEDFMRSRILAVLLLSVPAAALAADSRELTLPEAVKLALAHNRTITLARLKVQEVEQQKAGAKADYFPKLKNESSFLHITSLENIELPRGSFGVLPNTGPVPTRDVFIDQGSHTLETIGTSLTQPLTPLIRIRQENRAAASEIAASRDDVNKFENQIAVKVHEDYYGILVAKLQKQAAEQDSAYERTRLREAQEGLRDGSALNVDVLNGQAGLLQSEQSALTIDLRLSDLNAELNDLLGLPLDTRLVLSPAQENAPVDLSRDEMLKIAFATNPDITSAMESVEQAKAAVASAKSAYIPDISVFARQSYQNGVPFLVHNFGTFGASMNYDVFDFGKRRAAVRQREAQLAEAQENVERLKQVVAVEIEQRANKVEQTRKMLEVASEVVRLRTESERVAENQLKEGMVLVSQRRQASAANYKAQADLLQAHLTYMLAQAELQQTLGRTPGE